MLHLAVVGQCGFRQHPQPCRQPHRWQYRLLSQTYRSRILAFVNPDFRPLSSKSVVKTTLASLPRVYTSPCNISDNLRRVFPGSEPVDPIPPEALRFPHTDARMDGDHVLERAELCTVLLGVIVRVQLSKFQQFSEFCVLRTARAAAAGTPSSADARGSGQSRIAAGRMNRLHPRPARSPSRGRLRRPQDFRRTTRNPLEQRPHVRRWDCLCRNRAATNNAFEISSASGSTSRSRQARIVRKVSVNGVFIPVLTASRFPEAPVRRSVNLSGGILRVLLGQRLGDGGYPFNSQVRSPQASPGRAWPWRRHRAWRQWSSGWPSGRR